MNRLHLVLPPAVLLAAATLLHQGARPPGVTEERLWRHRNLGKAFYENPTTHAQAGEEFRQARELAPGSFRERLNYGLALLRAGSAKEGIAELEKAQKQDPSLPHTWFNLGIAYKREGRYQAALEQFERMVRLAPGEPISHYNLGLLYNLTGKPERATEEFHTTAKLDPRLVAPRFQIYTAYRLAGREEEAARALAEFQRVKQLQKAADESEDMEWSYYAEIYEPREAVSLAADAAPPLRFEARPPGGRLDPRTAGLLVVDADGDGRPDLAAWSAKGLQVYLGGTRALGGVDWPAGVVSVAAGDYDNDGVADLCVLGEAGAALYRNAGGKFEKKNAALPAGRFRKGLWLDYDHDYDLDLVLLGARSVVARNEGAAGFRAVEFPFVAGEALEAVPFRLIADGKGFDFVVSYRDRAGVLYRDLLGGQYEAVPLEGLPPGADLLQAVDIDNDSFLDVAFRGPKAVGLLLNRQGKLEAATTSAAGAFVFADLTNRGAVELVAGAAVYRNRGLGQFAAAERPAGLPRAEAWAEADFDQDGRTDLAALAPDGSLRLLLNRAATGNHWVRVGLSGVKNLQLSAGAEVEVKAGPHYQKKAYQGLPVLFGLRSYQEADTVRITWPNGMIQNQPRQAAGQTASYKEAPRLSGSCPMVYAWNGREFQFIADVLGVAPLGASAGDGKYFPVDHDEYVQIPGRALAAAGGRYDIRLVNELREVSYVDEVRLIAVDHPAGLEIFTNDKFTAPPFPEFRLYGVGRRIYPQRAVDEGGRNVLPKILRRDQAYPDEFRRSGSGVAEMHALELEFPAGVARDGRAILALNGWVDWADGSTFGGVAQEGRGGLILPYLQVKDAAGRWRTVIQDMGLPAGMPKTMVVDLTGKFLAAARAVRIVTNLCVHWDEVFLSEETAAPPARLTEVGAERAELEFHGFSELVTHAERRQPETFIYAAATPAAPWNSTPGLYTRYGEVGELLRQADDRYVIMASGDELRLRFDAAALPALPPGWKRDFLLLVDGWEKDQDANTAFSQSVEPLPFHAMSGYPYAAGERYPDDAAHAAYRRQYNTRPAMRLLDALAAQRGAGAGSAGSRGSAGSSP